MIEDLDALTDGTVLEADLCVVGAGAAGLLVARALADAGLEVLLLESGGGPGEERTQDLSEGEAERFRGLRAGRRRAFGGTTSLWGGQCIRLDRMDFEDRAWVPHGGWPFDAAALEPFYAEAEAALGVGARDGAEPVWPRFNLPDLAFDPERLRPVHGVFVRRPDLGRRFGAELRASGRVRVLLHATVLRLLTNGEGTRVQGAELGSLGGRRAVVRARRVVLCAGAIENARLLLLSDEGCPRGLGNAHDQVGRWLQDHPCGVAASVHTARPRVLQDHWNMLYGRGVRFLPKLALSEAAQRRHRVLSCVGRLAYDYDEGSGTRTALSLLSDLHGRRRPARLGRRLGRLALGTPELAASAWRVGVRGLSPAPRPRRILLEAFGEQAPDPDSRVRLGTQRDAFGQRRARLEWRLDALTGATLRCFVEQAAAEFARLGLGRVEPHAWLLRDAVPQPPDVLDSFHPAGTTRMATHPRAGVVDPHGEVFGVEGLFVAGSSTFPTSGAANPTLTIAAMALRLAARLRALQAAERMARLVPARAALALAAAS